MGRGLERTKGRNAGAQLGLGVPRAQAVRFVHVASTSALSLVGTQTSAATFISRSLFFSRVMQLLLAWLHFRVKIRVLKVGNGVEMGSYPSHPHYVSTFNLPLPHFCFFFPRLAHF